MQSARGSSIHLIYLMQFNTEVLNMILWRCDLWVCIIWCRLCRFFFSFQWWEFLKNCLASCLAQLSAIVGFYLLMYCVIVLSIWECLILCYYWCTTEMSRLLDVYVQHNFSVMPTDSVDISSYQTHGGGGVTIIDKLLHLSPDRTFYLIVCWVCWYSHCHLENEGITHTG